MSPLTKRACVGLLYALIGIAACEAQSGPQFETWKDDAGYHRPAYPVVFIATYRDASINNGGNLGTDVLEAGAPTRGQELWILNLDGTTEKLFPIEGVHEPYVDVTPIGSNPIIGSVSEPSVSLDGRRVYFSYFHDATTFPPYCCQSTGHSNFDGWPAGGDLYALEIGPKLDDPAFPVDQLAVSRLTQTLDEYADAMNAGTASATNSETGGVVYIGALEVDLEFGRKLVFVSNRRQLKNSNTVQHKKNKNFNLFIADLVEGATLSIRNINQYQYYTTTSALSPNRLRQGLAVSYQATTEENRQWQIQALVGSKWSPLYGYGIVAESAHLGTLCVKTASGALPAGDYEILTQYYNANNNGFGFIAAQDLSQLGLNTYDNWSGAGVGYLPKQIGSYNLSPGVKKGDYPSPVGKYTAPACGGPDELYLTYDPGDANHRNSPYAYHPQIVFTDLEPANPTTPGAYLPVVVSSDPGWGALWPKPLIDWDQRLTGMPHPTGQAKQTPPASVIDPAATIAAGAPHAILGTSALYNTDVMPVDCKDVHGYYDPYEGGNTVDQIFKNIESLSRVIVDAPGDIVQQTGSCSMPNPEDIFGIAVYLTSNKVNKNTYSPDYRTEGGNTKESKRLLGTFEVGMAGQADTSFKALVPANVPFDFHLLDDRGLKLADVRTWHSLKPRESRVDCGGCHNHREDGGIDWQDSDSSNPAVIALDMSDQTTYIEYDAFCEPVLQTSPDAVIQPPVWQALSQDFHGYCGDCHTQSGPGTTNESLNALTYDPAKLDTLAPGGPLDEMFDKKYIDRFSANASRLFWAAYGARTDGRDNDFNKYQPNPPDYSDCQDGGISRDNCGFKFSAVHETLGLCNGTDPDGARWVYRLAQWIDNHAPIDTGSPYDYGYDRYHPTVDGALVGGPDCLHPKRFDVGYWDDSGGLAQLDIEVNGAPWRSEDDPAELDNGVLSIPIGRVNIVNLLPVRVKVRATDPLGNTQAYEKTVLELVQECVAAGGSLPGPRPKPIAKVRGRVVVVR